MKGLNPPSVALPPPLHLLPPLHPLLSPDKRRLHFPLGKRVGVDIVIIRCDFLIHKNHKCQPNPRYSIHNLDCFILLKDSPTTTPP